MKKYLFTVVLLSCLFSFTALNAQQRLHFGLQSGIVFSKAGISLKSDFEKNGFDLKWLITNASNFYASYELMPKFSLAVEPGLILKANDQNGTITYIQLPILAEYNVIDRLHLTAGPEFNFLLNNDSQRSYKGFDTAAQLGAYYGVSYNFDLGFKFSRSLGNFLKNDIPVRSGDMLGVGNLNFYHYYFQFYTRYKF